VGGPANRKVNFREKEKQILDKILGANHYDRRIRPSGLNSTGTLLHLLFLLPAFEWCFLSETYILILFSSFMSFTRVHDYYFGPSGPDGATIVNINLMFRGISAISDNKMVSS